ncbi:hypothetical protein GCM10023152_01650 [Agromyces bauzanensis]|uniref:Uncharacterized protein n=1 Tax=Agromyces bauzanensis TaxID=1308924 RepID=A0A917UQ06_9MICO|nr:hypothetical protein GCM10011372_10040 [Agromyces bauzanensis]
MPTVVDRFVSMQRRAGNVAVAESMLATGDFLGPLVQRAPVTVQRVALSGDDISALAERMHRAMDRWGTDEEAIFVSLQELDKDAAAIAKLKAAYRTAHAADLESAIRSEMSGTELALALELLGVSGSAVKAAPASDADYKAAARTLHGAMDRLGTDEEAVYSALIPMGRDQMRTAKLSSTYDTEYSGGLTGRGLAADIADEMSSDEAAYALYLLHAPAPRAPTAEVVPGSPGTEEHAGTIPGGKVSVRSGADFTLPSGAAYPGGFTVGYEGALAPDTGWIQFLWSEVVATQADGSSAFVSQGGIPTTKGTMSLTTDPSSPIRTIDSASADDPFYESAGVDIRTPTSTVIYDRPSEFGSIVSAQFDGGATKVVERDHFDQFLVQDYNTVYHTTVVVEWAYTSKTSSTRTTKGGGPGKVSGMPAHFKSVLISLYPKFAYVQ